MRSRHFASFIAQRSQTALDGEVLAVATILHDVGLAEEFKGPLRFEVEGANAARAFARDHHSRTKHCAIGSALDARTR